MVNCSLGFFNVFCVFGYLFLLFLVVCVCMYVCAYVRVCVLGGLLLVCFVFLGWGGGE